MTQHNAAGCYAGCRVFHCYAESPGPQHSPLSITNPSKAFFYCYAECHNAECHSAECGGVANTHLWPSLYLIEFFLQKMALP